MGMLRSATHPPYACARSGYGPQNKNLIRYRAVNGLVERFES